MGDTDVVVVGAGIVGLAAAYSIQQQLPGATVVVIDKEERVAAHQTGHNSGVIHSGIYYPPGSNKATMVRHGRELLFEYCERHDIATDLCGKVIVATRADELERLRSLQERASQHGLETEWFGPAQLREREPHADGIGALNVPAAGITDYKAMCRALAADIEAAGGQVRFATRVESIDETAGGARVHLEGGGRLDAAWLVNCGGLHSDRVAQAAGHHTEARIMPFRGEYYELTPSARGLVKHLIYPVPDPRFPFLGVHFTRMTDGSTECGPNAVFTFKREGYGKTDFSWRDSWDALTYGGTWKLFFKNMAYGIDEYRRAFSKRLFLKTLRRLVPSLEMDDIAPGRAGVRAMLLGTDGEMVDDFRIERRGSHIHVLNAPSPAATACLAIGEQIVEMAVAEGVLGE